MYSSPKIFRVIKSKKNAMGGACSAYGGEEVAYRVLMWKREGKRLLGNPRVDLKTILRWIFRNCGVGVWTVLSWFVIGTDDGHL
jgi:hypothetical protein